METIIYTICVAVIFGLMILLHEFGHLMVAKQAGMEVQEFAIGFGPILISAQHKDTRYSLRAVPVGGFVKIAGMDPEEDVPNGFDKKPVASRMAVIAAGSFMNILLAIVLFCLIYMIFGKPVGVEPVVNRVMAGGPAQRAGLQTGDRILAIDEVRSLEVDDLRQAIQNHPGEPITIAIDRAGHQLTITLVPDPKLEKRDFIPKYSGDGELIGGKYIKRIYGQIGITFRPTTERLGFWESIKTGMITTYLETVGIFRILALSIMRKVPFSPAGPVGIVGMVWDQIRISWVNFLSVSAVFTLWIAFFNLFPFPPFDGGRLVFLVWEVVRGKPIDRRKEALIHLVGFMVIVAAILAVTFYDIIYRWGPE